MGSCRFVLALLLLAPALAFAEAVRVRIYNYAKAPEPVLEEAKGYAERTFDKAGIDLNWVKDPMKRRKPGDLALRIVPERMVLRRADRSNRLGYAVNPPDGRRGYVACVYFDRIERKAKVLHQSSSLVLGVTIAHEIGHLLLGSGSHSRSGVMSSPLSRGDIRLAARGRLEFTPKQKRQFANRFKEQWAARKGR